jgi:hypothetical protein
VTSLFSAPAQATRRATAASPPPATNPFQAPDLGEDETYPFDEAQAPAPGVDAGPRTAG